MQGWTWEGVCIFSASHHTVSQAKQPVLGHSREIQVGENLPGRVLGRGHAPSGLVSTYIGCLFVVVDVVNVSS